MKADEVLDLILNEAEQSYRDFQCSLMPGVLRSRVIGVRIPVLRKIAKNLDSEKAKRFIAVLPHTYYEEYNLHAFILEREKNFEVAIFETERLLPYIDNWATCDMFYPKIFEKHKPELYEKIKEWLKLDRTYTVRFGIKMLMKHFLGNEFKDEYCELVLSVKSEDYYVKMMKAWYFSTALALQYDSVVKYVEEGRLDVWTHNKTIQKAIESFRISEPKKQYLKSFRKKTAN